MGRIGTLVCFLVFLVFGFVFQYPVIHRNHGHASNAKRVDLTIVDDAIHITDQRLFIAVIICRRHDSRYLNENGYGAGWTDSCTLHKSRSGVSCADPRCCERQRPLLMQCCCESPGSCGNRPLRMQDDSD